MAETDVADNSMPAAPLEETDEQRRQRLAQLPLANALPPAPADAATAQSAPPPAIMPAAPPPPAQGPANANAAKSVAPDVSAMPAAPAPIGPAQQRLKDLTAKGPPKLPFWKQALDVLGGLHPIGREIEANIPGSPQNYSARMNQAAVRASKEQELAGTQQQQTEAQQRIEKGARDTPQARQKYMQDNPDQFKEITPFETADFILTGKMPAHEPEPGKTPEEATLHDLMTGGENGGPRINPDTQKPYTYLEAFGAENQAKQTAKPDKNDKKIDEFVDTNNKRINVMQRPDGTTYNAARGAVRMEAGIGAPNDIRDIAQGIVGGQDPPDLSKYGYRDRTAIAGELKRAGFDLATAQQDWQATQKHLATLNGQQQERLRQAITFTSDSLGIIDDLYNQWQKVGATAGWKAFNKASLATAKQLPGQAGQIAHQLDAQINDLTSELGTVYKGGNSSTDDSLKLAAKNLESDWNERTFKAAMDQIRQNLRIRQNSITHSLPAGVSGNSPYTPQGERPPGATTGGFGAWKAQKGQ